MNVYLSRNGESVKITTTVENQFAIIKINTLQLLLPSQMILELQRGPQRLVVSEKNSELSPKQLEMYMIISATILPITKLKICSLVYHMQQENNCHLIDVNWTQIKGFISLSANWMRTKIPVPDRTLSTKWWNLGSFLYQHFKRFSNKNCACCGSLRCCTLF